MLQNTEATFIVCVTRPLPAFSQSCLVWSSSTYYTILYPGLTVSEMSDSDDEAPELVPIPSTTKIPVTIITGFLGESV